MSSGLERDETLFCWGGEGGVGSGNHLMRVALRGELQFIHTDGSSVTGQVCSMLHTRRSDC